MTKKSSSFNVVCEIINKPKITFMINFLSFMRAILLIFSCSNERIAEDILHKMLKTRLP